MVPDPERASASVWIEAADTRLLVDVGWGSLQRMESLGLGWQELERVLLTHFHGDHTGNLPALMAVLDHGPSPRRTPVEILGGPGLRDRLRHMAGAFGEFMTEPAFPLTVTELSAGDALEIGDLRLECDRAVHRPESLAYRFSDGEGRVAGVTGDTGPSDELARFMRGTDLLVTECAFPDPPGADNHLSPRGLAEMLRVAEPTLTLLTHTYPEYSAGAMAIAVEETGYGGEVTAASDGTTVEWTDQGPELV